MTDGMSALEWTMRMFVITVLLVLMVYMYRATGDGIPYSIDGVRHTFALLPPGP